MSEPNPLEKFFADRDAAAQQAQQDRAANQAAQQAQQEKASQQNAVKRARDVDFYRTYLSPEQRGQFDEATSSGADPQEVSDALNKNKHELEDAQKYAAKKVQDRAQESETDGQNWAQKMQGDWGFPSFASGIDVVPHDMVAQLHAGEKVVPAAENPDVGAKQFPSPQNPVRILSDTEPVRPLPTPEQFMQGDTSPAVGGKFGDTDKYSDRNFVPQKGSTPISRVVKDDESNRAVSPQDYMISVHPGIQNPLHLPANAPASDIQDICQQLHSLWDKYLRGK